jgi:hypothetical protein
MQALLEIEFLKEMRVSTNAAKFAGLQEIFTINNWQLDLTFDNCLQH